MNTLACLGVLALGRLTQAIGSDLVSPPGHTNGICHWNHFDGKPMAPTSRGASPTYSVAGGPYGMEGVIESFTIARPPTEHKLTLIVELKGTSKDQTYAVVAAGINTKSKAAFPLVAEWEKSGHLSPSGWTRVAYDLCLPDSANYLKVVMHNPNAGAIEMRLPHLNVGEAGSPDLAAVAMAEKEAATVSSELKHPTASPFQRKADDLAAQPGDVVAHLHVRAPVCTKKIGEVDVVTFPIPTLSADQAPLAFQVSSQPPGRIISFKSRMRKDGRNRICEVVVKPGTVGAWVQYDSLVLVRKATPSPAEDREAHEWLEGSACVQSTAPEIAQIERRLSKPGQTTEEYARAVFDFVKNDMGKGGPFKALDALAALQCGGSCTNKANLTAALLRAHGIPARTVSHMPTWCTEALYEHWLAEYWQQGKGWVAIDSALGRWAPDRRTRVVLATSNLRDENLAFDPLHERLVMPGAAYLSSAELGPKLYAADLSQDDAINTVSEVGRFEMSPTEESSAFAAAKARSKSMFQGAGGNRAEHDSYDRLLQAARTGNPRKLLTALK